MSELKPCPFCGGEAERYTVLPQPGFENRQVQCRSCGATAFDLKWQTRTPEPAAQDNAEIVERLRGALEPFAKAGELFDNQQIDDRYVVVIYHPAAGDEYKLTDRHLRHARAAIRALATPIQGEV